MNPLAVIPARFASTRFPGKPLHLIAGKPLVQHVWERVSRCRSLGGVVIATDDDRIAQVARSFGAEVEMTREDHPTGTDRLAEVALRRPEFSHLINVQGDEPLISPELIDSLSRTLISDAHLPMITAASPLEDEEAIANPNIVKVVLNREGNALYFSRSPLPYTRNTPLVPRYRHMGIYGYAREFLLQFIAWPPSPLELTESLEQLRALENGATIRVVITEETSPGVDTLEQALEVESLILGGV
jgi:3-deoxy-manno-octulosonate cytidylyltransferase (CMP-KDO synthetase)